ncbi:MAG TPA: LysR substrate-binding domain-containing protein [Nakamurella sp.]
MQGSDAPRGLNHRVVGRDELVLVAPPGHPLTRRSAPLPLQDLADWPLVTREPRRPDRHRRRPGAPTGALTDSAGIL